MQRFCIHFPSYNSSCITLSRFLIPSIIVITDRWICVHLSMYMYSAYVYAYKTYTCNLLNPFVLFTFTCVEAHLLGIGQMVGEIISIEKCLFLSHRHWIPIALNIGVELFVTSAFHVGISACFVIILLLLRYPYCYEVKVQFADIYRRHYLTAHLLFFWLL